MAAPKTYSQGSAIKRFSGMTPEQLNKAGLRCRCKLCKKVRGWKQ